MAAVISNYVKLVPGRVVAMHFRDHAVAVRDITDPIRKVLVKRQSLLFYVDEVDGAQVDMIYSILSEKHAQEFSGYLEGKKYVGYTFGVVKEAAGFVPPKVSWVRPR